jgi:hypothetical protein
MESGDPDRQLVERALGQAVAEATTQLGGFRAERRWSPWPTALG